MGRLVKKGDVVLVALDPTKGHELKKTRPCIVVSPNEMNNNIQTIIVVPLTTKVRGWKHRCKVKHNNQVGEACTENIRSIDKSRIVKKEGRLNENEIKSLSNQLLKMFQY